MQGQGPAENESHGGKLEREIGSNSLEIFDDMRARGEKVREQRNASRTLLHATPGPLRNCRLDNFEVRDFDDRVMRAAADGKGQVDQIAIGFGAAAAMRDQERGRHFWSG